MKGRLVEEVQVACHVNPFCVSRPGLLLVAALRSLS